MAYYFMVEKKKGIYQELNISNSECFQIEKRAFKKPCAYSLKEIDIFTMMFNDEKEMRERLVHDGILEYGDLDKKISIRCLNSGKYSKVPYGFMFQDDIEYFMEPDRLVKLISKRCYDGDYALIKKIVNFFSDYTKCRSTAPEVNDAINTSIRDGVRCRYLDLIDENGDRLVERLIKLIILDSYDDYGTGRVIYTTKVNYRNLHELIALIDYYDKSKEIFAESKSDNKVLTKKLSKKKYILDDQMSFDI